MYILSALDAKPEIIRYEKETPGEMIHIDIKKLGRIEGIGHRITPSRRLQAIACRAMGDRTGQSTPRSRKEGAVRAGNTCIWRSTTTRAWPTPRSSPTRGASPACASFAATASRSGG
jgi:hypothetical protein